MGTYTTNLKFYKPDPTEFVDVETQLNDNWDMADAAVRRLFEYEYSNESTPTTDDHDILRQRFYKTYSNSLVNYFKASSTWIQDATAFVSPWVDATSIIHPTEWKSHPSYPLAYRIIKKSSGTTTEIEWTGAIWQEGTPLDLNSNISGVVTMPTEIRPVIGKYFNVNCGNTTTSYSFARLFFGSNGDVQFKRYGTDPPGDPSDENRVEFTGIKYNLEVTG